MGTKHCNKNDRLKVSPLWSAMSGCSCVRNSMCWSHAGYWRWYFGSFSLACIASRMPSLSTSSLGGDLALYHHGFVVTVDRYGDDSVHGDPLTSWSERTLREAWIVALLFCTAWHMLKQIERPGGSHMTLDGKKNGTCLSKAQALMFARKPWSLIHWHVFESDAVDKPLRPMANRFCGCSVWTLARFLLFWCFAVCFAVSAGETQVWLGDLRVVVFGWFLWFLCVVLINLPAQMDMICPCTNRGGPNSVSKNHISFRC